MNPDSRRASHRYTILPRQEERSLRATFDERWGIMPEDFGTEMKVEPNE